jgi:hypothetical protein
LNFRDGGAAAPPFLFNARGRFPARVDSGRWLPVKLFF